MYLNKSSVLKAIKRKKINVDDIFPPLLNDRDIALELVKYHGMYLQIVGNKNRDDFEIALAAVKEDMQAIKFISDRLKNSKEFALELVQCQYGYVYISDQFSNDYDVMMEAIKENVDAFLFASLDLRANKEFVLEAVRRDKGVNGSILVYASQELCDDKEVILEAIRHNVQAIKYASILLHDDKDVVLEALKQDNREIIKYIEENASRRLLEDPEIAIIIIRNKKRILLERQKVILGEIEVAKSHYNSLIEEEKNISDEISSCEEFIASSGRK